MTPRIIGSILATILIAGCETKTTSDQNKIAFDTINTKDTTESKNVTSDSLTSSDDLDNSKCIRGQAESVTNKTIFPHAVFKLNQDNHTGTETLDLKDRDKLIINNWGCEYYVLTFRFETDRFEADTTNTIFWLNKATILMTEIENGLNAPLDIKGGINAIPIYLASLDSQSYQLGDEIVYDDDVIRDFVTLDRIQKISKGRFAIEISFATGPL